METGNYILYIVYKVLLGQQERRYRNTDGFKLFSFFHQTCDQTARILQGIVANGPYLPGVLGNGAVADLDFIFLQSSLQISGNGLAAQNLLVKFGVKDSVLVWTVFLSGRYGSVEIFQDRGHIRSIGRTGADADLGYESP